MSPRVATAPRTTTSTHSHAAGKRPGLRPAAITAAMIAQLRSLAEPRWSADGKQICYLESHDGQGTLLATPSAGGPALRLTSDPPAASAAAYAGGFYAVTRDSIIYQGADRALYRMPAGGGHGHQLPTGGGGAAGPVCSPDGTRVAYVTDDGATSDIGIVDVAGDSWPRKLAVDADFVADPVWSPNGRMLAWVEWSVPNMAWDESRLVIYDLRSGERRVVLGEPEVSVGQPRWSPDGKTLAFLCDRDGYLNLWRASGDGAAPTPWITESYDHGGPTWGTGQASYSWSADSRRIAFIRDEGAAQELCLLDVATSEVTSLAAPAGSYAVVRFAPRGDRLLVLRNTPTLAPAIEVLDVARGTRHVVASAALGGLDGTDFVEPEAITWRAEDDLEIHGLLYRPTGLHEDQRPPLLVYIHGGPTGHTGAAWNPSVQYFVQRGWAVLAPNARGSSGHGRAYIQALRDEWGGADMADIVAGVDEVVRRGWADGARVVPWGGSAGGYAVLLLPILYPDRFKAAVSLFGVSDLFSLARTTHRLEAHYLDRILGPLPATAARYRERSPVFHAARYGAPLLMLQGDRDVAVTPDQAHAMADALRAAGKTAILHLYEGEGHGWLRAATVRDYLARMDRFLEEYALLR
ncbi:MAG TPA: alpha/beta fold hydrolase [Ktedonobacterales bacterium]|nr:alpha/beta fold hydrolase [Ktedonobacterales bacterium]